jgi:hypothetical protein
MHQEQPMTNFLFRYESTSGLWVETMLASQVSSPLLEAMNAILLKDGILAFIGTKSEYGLYKTVLRNLREPDSTGFWTSLPEHTILATLGLCLNPSTGERRSLVFHGNPRTLMLGYLIDISEVDQVIHFVCDQMQECIERGIAYHLDERKLAQINPQGLDIYPNELQDSLADFTSVIDLEKIFNPAHDLPKVDA